MNCTKCNWHSPDCRICKQDEYVRLSAERAEQIGTATLRILHPKKSLLSKIFGG